MFCFEYISFYILPGEHYTFLQYLCVLYMNRVIGYSYGVTSIPTVYALDTTGHVKSALEGTTKSFPMLGKLNTTDKKMDKTAVSTFLR